MKSFLDHFEKIPVDMFDLQTKEFMRHFISHLQAEGMTGIAVSTITKSTKIEPRFWNSNPARSKKGVLLRGSVDKKTNKRVFFTLHKEKNLTETN